MRQWWLTVFLLLTSLEAVFGQQGPGPGEKTEPKTLVSWKDGKTSFTLEKAHLELSNRLQTRFSLTDENSKPTVGSFRIRRFKTKLEGWAYRKDLTFELQLNWADDKPLEDANVAYDFSHGKKLFVLKGGQFKVPFGRQELTSSGNQQFVDRSLVSTEFAKGRDIGVQLSGLAMGGKLDWRVGAFNGAGRNATSNDNAKLQYDARLTWQPWGEVKYSEGDLGFSDKPLLAVAGQYELNDRRGATAGNDLRRSVWGADAVFQYRGWWFFSEYFTGKLTPEVGQAFTRKGFNVQLGKVLLANKMEIAARWAELDPSSRHAGDLRKEYGLVFGYFFNRHTHKLQSDLRRLQDQFTHQHQWEFRVQYQLIF